MVVASGSARTMAGRVALLLIGLSGVPTRAQQAPDLVEAPGHTARASLGASGQAFEIASAILGQTRTIGIALPASFARSAADRRYPVTIVFDGEENLAAAAAASAELAHHGLVPESIVVAIENTDPFRGRVRDLTPPGLSVSGSSLAEGGDLFLDFLEQELLPAVGRQFRGGAPYTLIGHSSGGILATYAAATRPGFRAVIAIDAPIHFGENWLAKKLLARASAPGGPLRYVDYDVRFPWPDAEWQALTAAAPAGWTLHREHLDREGHETVFMLGAYLGLREVFGDWSRLAAPVAPTTSILPYYAGVSAAFGAHLVPPERLLRDVTEDLLMEGRGAAAREAHDELVSGYGAPEDDADLLARIADVESRPPPTETVEGLLATPFPSPEEARTFVGDWVGDLWMGSAPEHSGKLTLRIRIVDGRVTGETVNGDAPGGPTVQPWQYMRITPAGLTWGYMNGMRPRGVVLFEGTLQGDTLSGTQRFGGIEFRPPEGVPNVLLSFEFRRATG